MDQAGEAKQRGHTVEASLDGRPLFDWQSPGRSAVAQRDPLLIVDEVVMQSSGRGSELLAPDRVRSIREIGENNC
jgi:hypothetical protein